MTELADPKTEIGSQSEPDSGSSADCERSQVAAARLRDRAERVRRRELETALGQLEARGEVTPAERQLVADLAADLADSLVEGWVAALDEGDVDPDRVLALLDE